jgi:formiminotetrahydrofolate cyclodeaminase
VTRSPGHQLPFYLEQPLGQFLGGLAAGQAVPAGGSAAALAVALGASLCAKAARLSVRQLADRDVDGLIAEAERLCTSAGSLIQADAESYQGVLEALRDRPDRDLDVALSQASAIPMEVIELGADTARLAERLAADGNPGLRADAVTAALLAEAGARAAAVLVAINLARSPADDRPARAGTLLAEITSAARAAEKQGRSGPPGAPQPGS